MTGEVAPDGATGTPPTAIVAGHICLDIIPTILAAPSRTGNLTGNLIIPGKRTLIGPATISTGGAVSNTGLALHRLGVPTRLLGKVGQDTFGQLILDFLRSRDPQLAKGMIIDPSVPSSYTIVISAPDLDRSFLHCAGANDSFSGDDIDVERIQDATLFHFGYPTSMRRIYEDGGLNFARLLQRVKTHQVATSLDTAHVDGNSASGWVDWPAYFQRIGPYVDFFLPSLDELFFMLDRARYEEMAAGAANEHLAVAGGIELLRDLASMLLNTGMAVVGIKLGDQGFYLLTTANAKRLQHLGKLSLSPTWLDRELLAPAFQVTVAGTTGAGDCAVAGFLASVLRRLGPEDALTYAVAAGACNVEVTDATSGVPSWDNLQARIQHGWPRRTLRIDLPAWRHDERTGLWHSPSDAKS